MNIFIIAVLFGILFAVLNRIRGSEILNKYKIPNIAKILSSLLCGFVFYYATGIWWTIIVAAILYRIGESIGWGKWVVSVLDRRTYYEREQGKTEIFGVTFWDGIHHIANWVFPEKEDYLNYSRLALFIRGIYFWTPLLIFGYALGLYHIATMIGTLLAMGVAFPMSFEISRFVSFEFPILVKLNNNWQQAEIIYGFLYGFILVVMFTA